jgi:cob(I)alamin adenosyltransferase
MKVYTKTEQRNYSTWRNKFPKIMPIESYGTVDELNSYIGLIRDQEMNAHYKDILIEIQIVSFTVGAILATPPERNEEKR